jgi:ferritin-like metal-binding protein YciE
LLEKFFLDQLKDIYWAEKALLKALPKMQKKTTTEELQQAFEDHTAVTQEQAKRLEQVFEMMGKRAQAKKCEAMEGLIKESEEIIEETEDGSMTRDVALIMAAQKVEHYEIATYGGLVQLAHTMNLTEIAEILEQTLQEEKDTDQLLTYIAENDINMEAEMEGAGTGEENE